MAFELPPLPWAEDALEPAYSARTVSFHYGKHHKAYVDKLNELAAGTPYADMKLEDVIADTAGKADKAGVFNNSAQVWNHSFFWHSMTPGGGGKPQGELAAKIDETWGGYDKFVEAFVAAAVGRFGSGWAWLVSEGGALKIVTTPNAETPLTTEAKALLTVDVWEHAYYLDYQNLRPKYVQVFFESLADWDQALARYRA
jgi:Fe-Mn family superoxide dismutase